MEDHLSVICGTDKGWTQGQVISIEDFQRQRFLLREKGSGTREVFNRVVEQAGFHITPVWEAMSTTALVNAPIRTASPKSFMATPGITVSRSITHIPFLVSLSGENTS